MSRPLEFVFAPVSFSSVSFYFIIVVYKICRVAFKIGCQVGKKNIMLFSIRLYPLTHRFGYIYLFKHIELVFISLYIAFNQFKCEEVFSF